MSMSLGGVGCGQPQSGSVTTAPWSSPLGRCLALDPLARLNHQASLLRTRPRLAALRGPYTAVPQQRRLGDRQSGGAHVKCHDTRAALLGTSFPLKIEPEPSTSPALHPGRARPISASHAAPFGNAISRRVYIIILFHAGVLHFDEIPVGFRSAETPRGRPVREARVLLRVGCPSRSGGLTSQQ